MRPEIFDKFNNYADFDINPWSYDFYKVAWRNFFKAMKSSKFSLGERKHSSSLPFSCFIYFKVWDFSSFLQGQKSHINLQLSCLFGEEETAKSLQNMWVQLITFERIVCLFTNTTFDSPVSCLIFHSFDKTQLFGKKSQNVPEKGKSF